METLPGFVQRSLQSAFKLRDQFHDQVEEAQDVVQVVTDFIVHNKVNKKEVRAILQQRLDAQLAKVADLGNEVTLVWQRTQDLESELKDKTADKASYQAALAAQEAELRCVRPELLQLQQQQQLADLSNLCTAGPQQPAPTILAGDTLKSALRKVGSMITSMGPVVRDTQQQLCDEQAAHGKTRVELQQLQALLSSNKSAYSATQALLSSEQTAHATTRRQLQQAQEEGAAARAGALHQLQIAAARARDQAAELGRVRHERAASQTAAAQAEADLLAARQELQQVQAEMGRVRASLQAEWQRHTATQADVTRLEGEPRGERQRLAATQTHAGIAGQHAAFREANTQLQRQLQGLTEQLADANAREAALQANLAAREEEIQRLQQGQSSDERHRAALCTLERVLLPARHTPTPGTLADCLAALREAIEQEGEAYDEECEEEFERMAAQAGYTLNVYEVLGRGGHATTYRAHKKKQMVAIRFEDRQWDILRTLRDAVVEALNEVQPEATRAVEMLNNAYRNSLAVRVMGVKGVVTVHRARLQATSLGERMRLMTVMSLAGTQTVEQWVQQQRTKKYPDGYEHFLRLCLSIICQVAQTLASLEDRHYHGVDLKVDNVLISPGVEGCRPVLIDCFEGCFSNSNSTEEMWRLGIPATFMYAAPEVLTFLDEVQAGSSPTDGALSASDLSRADVWCLGVALAWMLYPGHDWMPFGHESRSSVQQAQSQWFESRDGPGAKPLSDILQQCTNRNVDSNLTELVEEVLRSCWEMKDERCHAHQLVAIIEKSL